MIESSKNTTIKIEAINEFGEIYKMEQTKMLFEDIGYGFTEQFGEMIDTFLRQMGYPKFGRGYILMESITEEEAMKLYDYLQDIRKN